MAKRLLAGVDVGTSGVKCIIADEDGQVLASSTQEYPLSTPRPGWAEQNPADWKNAVFETVRTVMEKSGVDKNDVVGIGISVFKTNSFALVNRFSLINEAMPFVYCLVSS